MNFTIYFAKYMCSAIILLGVFSVSSTQHPLTHSFRKNCRGKNSEHTPSLKGNFNLFLIKSEGNPYNPGYQKFVELHIVLL